MSLSLHRESIDALDCAIKSIKKDERGNNSFPAQITTYILSNSTAKEHQEEGFFAFIELMRKRAALVWEVYCAKQEHGIDAYDKEREKAVISNMDNARFFRIFALCVAEFRNMQIRQADKDARDKVTYVDGDAVPKARIDIPASMCKILGFHPEEDDLLSRLKTWRSLTELRDLSEKLVVLGKSLGEGHNLGLDVYTVYFNGLFESKDFDGCAEVLKDLIQCMNDIKL